MAKLTFLVLLLTGLVLRYDLPTVESRRAVEPITVDGRLNEKAWDAAQVLPLKDNITGDDLQGKAYASQALVTHDEKHLYIAFINQDRHIWGHFENRDDHLWNEEVIEVFIDTDEQLSTYIELEVSPNNVLFDSFITDTLDIDLVVTPRYELAGWQSAVAVDGTVNDSTDVDRQWTVEMALPFESLIENFELAQLTSYRWRINFYRIDRDSDGPTLYAWSPTQRRFHSPSRFGKLVFR